MIYNRFLPLIVFEQQPGVGVRKEIYKLRGLISSAHVRHPENDTPPILVAALKKQIGATVLLLYYYTTTLLTLLYLYNT